MAFTGTNDYITGRKPVPNSRARKSSPLVSELDMATADLALNHYRTDRCPAGWTRPRGRAG